MKFETLPPEVLLQCFGYLETPDFFYAFDSLNSRLNNLIRTIPLDFNLDLIKEFPFNDFCQEMITNPEIETK